MGHTQHVLSLERQNDVAVARYLNSMVIVSSFDLNHNDSTNFFTITAKEILNCPLCRSELSYRDSRLRMLKDICGAVRHFCLRRLRCQDQECNTLHTEFPSIIQPYKHYDSNTIQSVLDGSEDGSACVADDSTIRRWKTDFALAQPDINQRLGAVYARLIDEKVPIAATAPILNEIKIKVKNWLAFVMELLINSGNELCTRFAFWPSQAPDTVNSGSKSKPKGAKRDDKTIKNSS